MKTYFLVALALCLITSMRAQDFNSGEIGGAKPLIVALPIQVTVDSVLTEKDYYNTFIMMSRDSLPRINFSQFKLVKEVICQQCYQVCNHYQAGCHRNRCSYTEVWLKKYKSDIQVLPFTVVDCDFSIQAYRQQKVVASQKVFNTFNISCTADSLYQKQLDATNFEEELLLFRIEGGDCFARITHDVYLDHHTKELVWEITNEWGGCRAGGSWSFILKVQKPPVGYTVRYERILSQ